jgi:hypothetical protein
MFDIMFIFFFVGWVENEKITENINFILDFIISMHGDYLCENLDKNSTGISKHKE